MRQYIDHPESFVLPKQYSVLAPIISAYHNNLGGFLRYIRGCRDTLKAEGNVYAMDVQALLRKLEIRYAQRWRRERSTRAENKAAELYGPAPFQVRLAWKARLEHLWAKRRLAFMSAATKGAGRRLNVDERADLLAEFWESIDSEIAAGERLPRWEE